MSTKNGKDPTWYSKRNELEADVDLSSMGWGRFHIRDAAFGRIANQKRDDNLEATAMLIRAYMGPDTEGPKDRPWPGENQKKSDWVAYVAEMPEKVVDRIVGGIVRMSQATDEEALETEGN